jgi:hypothetical protein
MQIEQKQNCFLMLYAQLIVYNKYSWLFSENPTHFRRGLSLTKVMIRDRCKLYNVAIPEQLSLLTNSNSQNNKD